jgi:hypothetical protein
MRWAVLVVSSACMTHGIGSGGRSESGPLHIGAGVILSPHFQEARRDPDPTRPLVEEVPESPWRPERGEAPTRREDERAYKAAYYTSAALAVVLGGFIPMLLWSGTFDEHELAPRSETPPP